MKVTPQSLAGLTAAVLLMGVHAASAEIEKTATIGCHDSRICFHWWPKIIVPQGWKADEAFSQKRNINFIYPVADPNNVGIYASALEKKSQADTVAGFIADDRKSFLGRNDGMNVKDGPVFTTQDGQSLKSLVFDPAGKQNWDITAYGAETDKDGNAYYLTFTLSAPSQAQRDIYLPVLKQVIAAYHK